MHHKEYQIAVQERADLVNASEAIFTAAKIEGRSLTAAERDKIKNSQERVEALSAQIRLLEAERDRQRQKPVIDSPHSEFDGRGGRPQRFGR